MGEGHGMDWVPLRPMQVKSALVMTLGLNVVALQKKVIGFSSVMPTTILVGCFTRRIKKLDVSHHSQLILQLSSVAVII